LFGPGKDCPDIHRLVSVMAGSEDDSERRRMTAHVETCSYCRAELALYQSFEAATIEPAETAAVSEITALLGARAPEIFGRESRSSAARTSTAKVPWWRNRWDTAWLRPVALTAAGVLVVAAIGLQFRHGTQPALHPADDQSIMRSSSVTVIAPVGDLTATPTRIQWEAVSGAAKYRIRLLEVDRNELWAAESSGTSIDLPADVRARIVPGKSLLCQVVALASSGAGMAESGLVRFRVLRAAR
jgi:hypothetical protein